MNIQEMHLLFRLLGQQMGIQQVRGILPQSIDGFINSAIVDKIKEILTTNTTIDFKNKVAIQRNGVSPINALRTLYKEKEIINLADEGGIDITDSDVFIYLGVSIKYNLGLKYYNCRIVEPTELENLLNDYCNKDSKEYPIANISYDGSTKQSVCNIYSDGNKPSVVKVKYIAMPAKVRLDHIDCDLPEYLHNDIVELAVTKYFKSVGYTTPTTPQK